ncbi:MAG: insulinase family protein [Paludibacteraceae bacterium]|nr:insulinase family protein [Paludibacteraceae bacterium]
MKKADFYHHTLKCGIRIVFHPTRSDVCYLGLMMNTGTRDEQPGEPGMAHFVEHTIFKGTASRTSKQIIDRIEGIGGELNAYTTKEETVLYATVLTAYAHRAMDVMADMVQHACFPEAEICKELEVILDEIDSYKDAPAELIYDEFESMLFRDHPLGTPILGQPRALRRFKSDDARRFLAERYNTDQMVLFVQGRLSMKQLIDWAEQCFADTPLHVRDFRRTAPGIIAAEHKQAHHRHAQTHYLCGGHCYSLHHADRLGAFLLNNIMGGPSMNSRLNMSLRERNGLVYTVEGAYTPLTDTGFWTIYLGCDHHDLEHCVELLHKELRRIRERAVGTAALARYKRQLSSQQAIAAENQEGNILSAAKSTLHFGRVETTQEAMQVIDRITPADLMRLANEMYDASQMSSIIFQ